MRAPAVVLLTCSMIAGCSGTDRVDVRDFEHPVEVASIAAPVAVSGVAQPLTVSGIGSPVAISSVGAPIPLARPELDPDHIEGGTETSGTPFDCIWSVPCRELASGPLVLTDILGNGATSVRFSAGPSFDAPRWRLDIGAHAAITGARFAVRTGEKLYLEPIAGNVAWSGFRP